MQESSLFYNIEAEEKVLSLAVNDRVLPLMVEHLGDNVEVFYHKPHQQIYNILLSVINNYSDKYDVLMIKNVMGKQLAGTKAMECFEALLLNDNIISLDTLEYWCNLIKSCYTRRHSYLILKKSLDKVSSEEGDIDNILSVASKGIAEASSVRHSEAMQVKDTFDALVQSIQDRIDGKTNIASYGIDLMDVVLGGLQRSQIVTIAGRPGLGKSTMAENIAISAASQGFKTLVLSYEMDTLSLLKRYVVSQTDITYAQIDRWKIKDWFDKFGIQLKKSLDKIENIPLFFNEEQPYIENIFNTVARFQLSNPDLFMIVVDYLQVMPTVKRGLSEYERVTLASRELFRIGKKLKVCVLQLSQLSRSVERREDPTPMLSDLRESGAVEENSDIVGFLHRPGYYDQSIDPKICDIITKKNRNGPNETIPVGYDPAKFLFYNLKKDTERE